jgi:hypothetical protein
MLTAREAQDEVLGALKTQLEAALDVTLKGKIEDAVSAAITAENLGVEITLTAAEYTTYQEDPFRDWLRVMGYTVSAAPIMVGDPPQEDGVVLALSWYGSEYGRKPPA